MDVIPVSVPLAYLKEGLSILPTKRTEKRPSVGPWATWKERLPTEVEVNAWFANRQDGICLVCGAVSGNLECIDFDAGGECFVAWVAKLEQSLYDKLVIEQTPSGGYHVFYHSTAPVEAGQKLAMRLQDGRKITLIETRGEGNLCQCAPTSGYVLRRRDFSSIPVLSTEERQTLLNAARAFDECVSGDAARNATEGLSGASCADSGAFIVKPGDDFNARGDIRPILLAHGWQLTGTHADGNEHWVRPGKDAEEGTSATFNGSIFYVFSTGAAPFETKGYSKFQVYALLEHKGDFTAAARTLLEEGYGKIAETDNGVNSEAIIAEARRVSAQGIDAASMPTAVENSCPCRTIGDLIEAFPTMRKPLVHGLLRRGETMNVIAPPKIGKSWLVNSLAVAVALGEPWMGFVCEMGNVLVIDNELHPETTAARFKKLLDTLGIGLYQIRDKIVIQNQRGHLMDMETIISKAEDYRAFDPALIVIDAFYRTLPEKTDENDNAAITRIYNKVDELAKKLDCAVVLVHHTSKGNQALKSTTDSGAGAGAISRAADTHVVLRKHKRENCAVLDAVVRSWPSFAPFGLHFEYPRWVRDDGLDVEEIAGAMPKKDADEIPLMSIMKGLVELAKEDDVERGVCDFKALAARRMKAAGVTKGTVGLAYSEAIAKGYLREDRPAGKERKNNAKKIVRVGTKEISDNIVSVGLTEQDADG